MRRDEQLSQSKAKLSLQQVLAEMRDVEIAFLSADTAPAALKREFIAIPDDGVIAILTQVGDIERRNEIEGVLVLYTSWKILQRVPLEDTEVALLLVPA